MYQNPAARKTFVDVNNVNVSTNAPYTITNTPPIWVDVACPGWLTNGLIPMATIVSPDGPLRVTSLTVTSNRISLQLPPIAHYASVILQPTNNTGGGVALSPPNITVSISDDTLQLSWPADHLGWWLQAQTDSLGTNWFIVPGSVATNAVFLPINPVNRSVFYRLTSP